jgi:hypothetical protein
VIATHLTSLTFTNSGLTGGTTYYYVVSAANLFGESTDSIEVSAQTLPVAFPEIAFGISGGSILFHWPSDYIGWRLEMQTHPPGDGLGTNWVTVAGSANTNQIALSINQVHGSAFFRLAYP